MARVLVVEDDRIIQDLIVQVLEHAGYDCLTAVDGFSGVDIARTERPDVILMDLMLPVMNGVDAIRAIRSSPETRTCQIIAMSAGRNLAQVSGELDVDSVLGKPFDVDVLIADVALHVRQSFLH